MGKSSPKAFVSYHDEKPGSRVAHEIELAFVEAGFDVWSMRQETAAGLRWHDVYPRALKASHLFLAVVTRDYLASDYCQAEVGKASQRVDVRTILCYPFLLEPIHEKELDEHAAQAYDMLTDMGGFAKYRLPTRDEICHAAHLLRQQVTESGLMKPEAVRRAVSPVLPLAVKPAASAGNVFLILDESAPSAAAVKRTLMAERRARQSGRGRWTVSRDLFDGSLRQELLDAVVQAEAGGAINESQ